MGTRTIKFRGIDFDGIWRFGSLVYFAGRPYIVGELLEANDEYVILESWYPVKNETVGQDTGLKDSSGKEIYEGDVLSNDNSAEGVVRYRSGTWEVFLPDSPECFDRLDECYELETVFGNIHDNPELLEKS